MEQNVTNIIWFGYGNNEFLNYLGSPDYTIWYKTEKLDQEIPNLKEIFLQIIKDYLLTLSVGNKEYPNYKFPEIKYQVLITKVKGDQAWHHEYNIDPNLLLEKYKDQYELTIKEKE
jgi:hypothetical protein